jgi:hypothetical protein
LFVLNDLASIKDLEISSISMLETSELKDAKVFWLHGKITNIAMI